MFVRNEGGLERFARLLFGFFLIMWGYWTSGVYWLDYQVSVYPIPCWNWDNFIAHRCTVERGIFIAGVGLIPLLTGLIGWCPLKAIFKRTPKGY